MLYILKKKMTKLQMHLWDFKSAKFPFQSHCIFILMIYMKLMPSFFWNLFINILLQQVCKIIYIWLLGLLPVRETVLRLVQKKRQSVKGRVNICIRHKRNREISDEKERGISRQWELPKMHFTLFYYKAKITFPQT